MSLDCVVVGCGAIGSRFDTDAPDEWILTHAKACVEHDGARLVAGVDPDPERRADFEASWGAPAYPDLQAAVTDRSGVGVVCISTPARTHAEVIETALDVGADGILCEKPVAKNSRRATAVVERCEEEGVPLAVNYTRRYTPGCRRARRLIRAGELGEVEESVFLYTKGLLENGSHSVDLARWWFGPIRDVVHVEPGDEATAVFEFDNATCRLIGTGGYGYSYGRVDIYGNDGSLHLVDNGAELVVRDIGEDPVFSGFQKLVPSDRTDTGLYRAMLHALNETVDAVRSGEPPACSGRDAMETLRVCERLLDGN